jgi:hypothetical protein
MHSVWFSSIRQPRRRACADPGVTDVDAATLDDVASQRRRNPLEIQFEAWIIGADRLKFAAQQIFSAIRALAECALWPRVVERRTVGGIGLYWGFSASR